MSGAAAFLVLLLCLHWTWAQGESGGVDEENKNPEVQSEIRGVKATHDQSSRQTGITLDIWVELKELRDMAVEQKVELRNSKSKIDKLEQENADIKARLTASESKNAVLEARISSSENVVEELKKQNAILEARMSASENVIRELKRENADRPKVAFSLGLTDAGQVGPFNTDITLKFSKVFTNFGQAYNPTTGIFTAPVRGAYYFRFSAWDDRAFSSMGANLYHNGKRMSWNSDYNDEHAYISVTNALVLQLEKGDVVYMVLPANHGVWDDIHNRTTFSGFLLFSL